MWARATTIAPFLNKIRQQFKDKFRKTNSNFNENLSHDSFFPASTLQSILLY